MWNPVELLTRLLDLLGRHKNAAVLAGSLAVSLWLHAAAGPIGPPLRRLADTALVPVQLLTSNTLALLNVWVWKENRDLQERLLAERMDRLALDEVRLENARLRLLLDFRAPAGFRTIPCTVVAMDPEPFGASITIDRGTAAGLLGDESVVSVDGLVGRIVEIDRGRSRVRLLTHYEAPVAVRVQKSRVLGVVEWDPTTARLHMKNVPATEAVAEGDTLISSGMGLQFPEGLYVGRVEAVRLDPMGLVQDIVVRPGAHFNRLEELFVVMPLIR